MSAHFSFQVEGGRQCLVTLWTSGCCGWRRTQDKEKGLAAFQQVLGEQFTHSTSSPTGAKRLAKVLTHLQTTSKYRCASARTIVVACYVIGWDSRHDVTENFQEVPSTDGRNTWHSMDWAQTHKWLLGCFLKQTITGNSFFRMRNGFFWGTHNQTIHF